MGRRIVHLAMLTVRASATKEMHAIIGILLFASSSRQVTVPRARNSDSYTHPRKTLQLQRRSSRRLLAAVRMRTRTARPRKLRPRQNLKHKLRYSFVSLRLPVPALLPSRPRRCTSQSSRRRSQSETRSCQHTSSGIQRFLISCRQELTLMAQLSSLLRRR